MNTLYIEPFSGLSGDMFLSALCGLTDGYELIQSLPEKLNLPDGKVKIQQLNKNGIVCQHVKIIDLNQTAESHSHSHSHTHHHGHGHHLHHGHGHHHGEHHHYHLSDYLKGGVNKVVSIFKGKKGARNNHSHDHHHHNRGLKEINKIIAEGNITNGAKTIAKEIFNIIGLSESKIHNIPFETIHFHEVSAVDSILDIVGSAVLIDQLEVEKVYCDSACTGFGMVKTQHGMLPVPAPATFDIMKGMPMYKGNEKGEKLTPTGAAILKYLKPVFKVPTLLRKKTSYGPGEKNFRNPNVVRISIVEESAESNHANTDKNKMVIIETNLDDTSGELLGSDFQKELMKQGARDFHYTSVQMKKGRPGLKLSVLAEATDVGQISDYILENTSTIGVRYFPVSRRILAREKLTLSTEYGDVEVKEVTTPSGAKRHKIEYESLLRIKEKHNVAIAQLQTELYDQLRRRT